MNRSVNQILADFPEIVLEGFDEGDIVTDVVVIARVQSLQDTADSLAMAATDHTGGILMHGILTSGVLLHTQWMRADGDDNY